MNLPLAASLIKSIEVFLYGSGGYNVTASAAMQCTYIVSEEVSVNSLPSSSLMCSEDWWILFSTGSELVLFPPPFCPLIVSLFSACSMLLLLSPNSLVTEASEFSQNCAEFFNSP